MTGKREKDLEQIGPTVEKIKQKAGEMSGHLPPSGKGKEQNSPKK